MGLMGAGKPPPNGLGSFGGELAVIRRGSFLEGSDAGEAESRLPGLDRTLLKGLVVARGLQDGRALGGLNEYFPTRDKDWTGSDLDGLGDKVLKGRAGSIFSGWAKQACGGEAVTPRSATALLPAALLPSLLLLPVLQIPPSAHFTSTFPPQSGTAAASCVGRGGSQPPCLDKGGLMMESRSLLCLDRPRVGRSVRTSVSCLSCTSKPGEEQVLVTGIRSAAAKIFLSSLSDSPLLLLPESLQFLSSSLAPASLLLLASPSVLICAPSQGQEVSTCPLDNGNGVNSGLPDPHASPLNSLLFELFSSSPVSSLALISWLLWKRLAGFLCILDISGLLLNRHGLEVDLRRAPSCQSSSSVTRCTWFQGSPP